MLTLTSTPLQHSAFIELAERFSYYGSTVVFTNFIQQPLPPYSKAGESRPGDTSGALGMGQQAATGLVLFNQFWSYICPLGVSCDVSVRREERRAVASHYEQRRADLSPCSQGAYVADTYLGRYKTIGYSIIIALVGHTLLTCSAIPSLIQRPNQAIGLFAVAILIMGMGTGGFKSNISPLVAEQTKNTYLRVETRKNGKRVLVDPGLTMARVFMYFYLWYVSAPLETCSTAEECPFAD